MGLAEHSATVVAGARVAEAAVVAPVRVGPVVAVAVAAARVRVPDPVVVVVVVVAQAADPQRPGQAHPSADPRAGIAGALSRLGRSLYLDYDS